ncbi:hypothetical protein [Brevibacillus migulae]|uniref:hypothetical protein n=1 Tax=Brevibacillus migulae TaxID=1644114 RepID=UPI00106EC2A0|nr:hypothetical protein [Brevibacillus migulae]
MKYRPPEVLMEVESTYKDLLLRKSLKMRVYETILFVLGMLVLSNMFGTESNMFKVLAFAIAIAVVGLSPFFYKAVMKPRYTLTRTHLIVSISGQERSYPLNEVEPVIEGRHVFRLSGKRESLMVSREFLAQLNERLFYFRKKGKR